jgi:hypothetical protein
MSKLPGDQSTFISCNTTLGGDPIDPAITAALLAAHAPAPRLLVVLDQFEAVPACTLILTLRNASERSARRLALELQMLLPGFAGCDDVILRHDQKILPGSQALPTNRCCSARLTVSCGLLRARKSLRCSSSARPNRAAASKLPNPRTDPPFLGVFYTHRDPRAP